MNDKNGDSNENADHLEWLKEYPPSQKKTIGSAAGIAGQETPASDRPLTSNVDIEIARVHGRLNVLDTRLEGHFDTLEAKFEGMHGTLNATLGEIKAIISGQPAKLIVAIIMTVATAVGIAAGVLRILDAVPEPASAVMQTVGTANVEPEPTPADSAP